MAAGPLAPALGKTPGPSLKVRYEVISKQVESSLNDGN